MIKQVLKTLNPIFRKKNIFCMSQCYKGQYRECSQNSTSLARQLNAKIKATGPITVADYMKEVLVNPSSGYYTQHESIGAQGDFVTSPELSQLFGEMLAIWFLNEWQKVGSPKPMQLIELGPGKGTLMEDILRVFSHLGQLDGVSVHLVELSPRLQDAQAKRLCSEVTMSSGRENLHFASGITHAGCPVYWHHAFSEVPDNAFSCVLAHEFFDALPIHKLQKTEEGWREILIDINPAVVDDIEFRYIISRSPTPVCKMFSAKENEKRDHIEVCPDGGALLQKLAKRFEEDGGFLLMADYGHDGTKGDTFRGFSQHKLHDPLKTPGCADLTADVDFSFLKSSVNGHALMFGPETQQNFLSRLGIDLRLQVLLQNSTLSQETRDNLQQGVQKLTDSDQMGERFKFFSIFPKVLEQHLKRFPVAGFSG